MHSFLKKLAAAGLVTATLVACSSSETETVMKAAASGIAVGVSADEALAPSITKVTISVKKAGGDEAAALSLASATEITTATVAAGDYTVTADAFVAGSDAAVVSGSATVSLATGETKAVVIVLAAASAPGLTAVEAASAAPKTHTPIDLTTTFTGPTSGTAFAWSHDCRGTFADATAMNTSFSTPFAEKCTLTLTATAAGKTTSADLTLDFTWKKGTLVRVAGTTCNIYGGDTAWWEGEFATAPMVGENGPARDAKIAHVYGLRFGQDGDLYFTEREAGRLSKVELQTGLVRRLVGTYGGSTTRYTSLSPQAATLPTLYFPIGLVQDPAGNWITASMNSYYYPLHKYYPSGNTVAAYAYTTLGPSYRAYGVAMDANGVIYQTLPWNKNLSRFFPAAGTYDTMPGIDFTGGRNPGAFDIQFGPDGNLYVAERFRNLITRITPAGVRTIVAGVTDTPGDGLTTAATTTTIKEPFGLDVPANGKVYFTDTFNHKIRIVDGGVMTTVVGPGLNSVEGEAGVAAASPIEYPTDVARAPNGDLYVSQKERCQILKVAGPY